MLCNGCHSMTSNRTRTGYTDGVRWEHCNICMTLPQFGQPDIFLGGKGGIQTDENLCGDDGQPIPFSTKGEKAAIVKKLGLRQSESAERQHGSRNESHLHRKKYFV